MSSFKKVIGGVDRAITAINGVLLIIALAVMSILVFANVIGRYFFSYSVIWVDELSRYLMISLAFLGMGLAMREGNHSSFTMLQNALPDKLRKLLRIIVLIIIMASMLGLLFLGWQYAMHSMKNLSEALRWPVGYWYLMIPVGAFLFIWHTSMVAKEYINQKRDDSLETEISEGVKLIENSSILEEIELEVDSSKNEKEDVK